MSTHQEIISLKANHFERVCVEVNKINDYSMNYSIPASCPSVIGFIGERIRKYPTSSGEIFLSSAMISESDKLHIRVWHGPIPERIIGLTRSGLRAPILMAPLISRTGTSSQRHTRVSSFSGTNQALPG